MIMASHQVFSSQMKHMSSQVKFDQTTFPNIVNGKYMEFAKDNECPDNFQSSS